MRRHVQTALALLAGLATVGSVGCGNDDKKRAKVAPAAGLIDGGMTKNVRNACTAAVVSTNLTATESARGAIQHFTVDSIPICGHHHRVIEDQDGLVVAELGADLRSRALMLDPESVWPTLSDAVTKIEASPFAGERLDVSTAHRCWHLATDKVLHPAWEITVIGERSGWFATVGSDQVFKFNPAAIHAAGRVATQSEGVDFQRIEVDLDTMDDSGFLQGPNFRTTVPTGRTRASATNGNFLFETTDPRFIESSLYANAELALQKFRAVDPDHVSVDCFPFEIMVSYVGQGGDVNNAFYEPALARRSGKPGISVGDGNGEILRNLGRDPDVVGHELAHHVVYRGIQNISDFESLVLHEGLSDFFVYAATGNACLGESICPQNSGACWSRGKCLRTAENSIKLTDSNAPRDFHRLSQVISGMLWDLESDIGSHTATAKIVSHALNWMLPTGTYRDFITAMMLADRDLNAGRSACAIYTEAETRGLSEEISGLDCSQFRK